MAPPDERDYVPLGAVYDALRRGKKIDAIKRYRELTGATLAEAKYAVEGMMRGL